MSKIVSAEQAVSLIRDGMTLCVGGFYGAGVPEELLCAIQKHYLETQSPRGLTLLHGAGIGDSAARGLNHLGEEGLLKRAIGGHVGMMPRVGKLATENKLELFMIPQGISGLLCRAIGGNKPGVISRVGMRTFADPRLEGCKGNQAAYDSGCEVVSLMKIEGKDYLFYKAFPLDVCFIKATYADEDGNISVENEAILCDQLEIATATHNSGGIVMVQVTKILARGSLHPRNVAIHHFMVDYVVVGSPKNNLQTWDCDHYRMEIAGNQRIPMSAIPPLALDERKVCARRGAMELRRNSLVNVGIGIAEAVGVVAAEEGVSHKFTFSVESGPLGGIPLGGQGMGASYNFEAIYRQADTFDLYDGGGLDIAFLGAAQIDERGNVNVSKFSGRMVGPGGFINISQTSKKVCFLGTFTAGGLDETVENGKLKINRDGAKMKFIKKVEQVTFSGEYAMETGQEVLYITERAVFRLTPEGVMLTEIAPGVDLERDILAHMEYKPVLSPALKQMDERIFKPEIMGLGKSANFS